MSVEEVRSPLFVPKAEVTLLQPWVSRSFNCLWWLRCAIARVACACTVGVLAKYEMRLSKRLTLHLVHSLCPDSLMVREVEVGSRDAGRVVSTKLKIGALEVGAMLLWERTLLCAIVCLLH